MYMWRRIVVIGMVCAGCIGNTPEIWEVSILILYSDVLLNAGSVVGFWQCCTSHPVTVAMISCSQMWLLFPAMVFGEQCRVEEELGAFEMKRSSSSTLSTDWSDKSCCYQYPPPPPTPTKAYCSEVSSQSIFRWDVFKDDRSPSSLVCYNECVFSVNGVWFPHFQLPHTSSGSIGPSAPWGASVWSRRMGLLHMGQTLRISSHLSRHLAGKKIAWI